MWILLGQDYKTIKNIHVLSIGLHPIVQYMRSGFFSCPVFPTASIVCKIVWDHLQHLRLLVRHTLWTWSNTVDYPSYVLLDWSKWTSCTDKRPAIHGMQKKNPKKKTTTWSWGKPGNEGLGTMPSLINPWPSAAERGGSGHKPNPWPWNLVWDESIYKNPQKPYMYMY